MKSIPSLLSPDAGIPIPASSRRTSALVYLGWGPSPEPWKAACRVVGAVKSGPTPPQLGELGWRLDPTQPTTRPSPWLTGLCCVWEKPTSAERSEPSCTRYAVRAAQVLAGSFLPTACNRGCRCSHHSRSKEAYLKIAIFDLLKLTKGRKVTVTMLASLGTGPQRNCVWGRDSSASALAGPVPTTDLTGTRF